MAKKKESSNVSSSNEEARALFHRAGNANVAVAADTRPKIIRDKKKYTRKGKNKPSYQ